MTVGEFRRFVEATGHVPRAERPLDPAPIRTPTRSCSCRDRSCSPDGRAGRPGRLPAVVAVVPGAYVAAPGGARRAPSEVASAPGHPGDATRTPSPTRHGPARRGRPRRSGSAPPAAASRASRSLGRRVRAGGAACSRTPGRASSLAEHCCATGSAGRRRWGVPGQRLRAVRHGRQRLGVDRDFYAPRHRTRSIPVLRAAQPADDVAGGIVRVGNPGPTSRAGDQGRVAPVRAELLPPLPAGGAPGRGGRHDTSHIGFRCVVRADS